MHRKKRVIEISPTQIEVVYLDKEGNACKDPKHECLPWLFEAKFKGVDIDPREVVRIEFPKLDYRSANNTPLKVKVTVIDFLEGEREAHLKIVDKVRHNNGGSRG